MKKIIMAGLFLVSCLLVAGKEYTRNEDDSVNYFYTKVIIENNKVKMITKVVNKDDKSKSYIRTLTGEIKGNMVEIIGLDSSYKVVQIDKNTNNNKKKTANPFTGGFGAKRPGAGGPPPGGF